MENQKIINLLDKIDTDSKHFAGANNPDTIKYDTRVLKYYVIMQKLIF